ncbi:MAG: gamma-glutamylcyclotransferase family protein [Pseudomonadota bacterium]
MPLYFAYGSNLLPRQMAERCPGARLFCTAELPEFAFAVTPRGGANIVTKPDGRVLGALWQCTAAHLSTLDRFEGVRTGNYRRLLVRVVDSHGRIYPAITYISRRRARRPARVNYMLTAVLPGAIAQGLPAEYIAELSTFLPRVAVGEKRCRYRGRRS